MHPERKNVLQIGSFNVESKSFTERTLNLVPVKLDQVAAAANSACGIVIAESSGRIGLIRSWLEALKSTVEDFDLAITVLVPSSDEYRVVSHLTRELGVQNRTTVMPIENVGYAAHNFYEWNPGPPAASPKILTSGFNVSPRMELLLNRSFGDCDRIYLEPLGGGRDSMNVFCVHAWLKKSLVGLPRPLPFFIKASTPDKIAGELFNYTWYADFYIPFYLRPNVVPKRCARIQGMASIVGNFVEDSVPLRPILRSSQSPGIIFSLFETSLKGFRSKAGDNPNLNVLENFIRGRSRAVEVKAEVIKIAQDFNLQSTPVEIETRLCNAIKGVQRPFNPYHGDLHSGNIMVRGKDAILIDFSNIKDGPFTADPATLEVSLLFGTDENDTLAEFGEWKKAVDEIYAGVPFHQPPSLGMDSGPFSWLYRAIREIRHVLLGCDCKQEEAAAVLAAYLLRFGRLPTDAFEDKSLSKLAMLRQGYALVIAERIVTNLVASIAPK